MQAEARLALNTQQNAVIPQLFLCRDVPLPSLTAVHPNWPVTLALQTGAAFHCDNNAMC